MCKNKIVELKKLGEISEYQLYACGEILQMPQFEKTLLFSDRLLVKCILMTIQAQVLYWMLPTTAVLQLLLSAK